MISTDQRTETEQKAAYLDIYIFGTIKTVSGDQQISRDRGKTQAEGMSLVPSSGPA